MKLVYIHGASATGESFNYIREHLNHNNDIVIEYNSKNGFEENLAQMKDMLVNFDNMFFVCHSLGGIYANINVNSFGLAPKFNSFFTRFNTSIGNIVYMYVS